MGGGRYSRRVKSQQNVGSKRFDKKRQLDRIGEVRSATKSNLCDSGEYVNGSICNGGPTTSVTCDIHWRKILYEKQPFPDNYTSPKFLSGLQKNVTARMYSLEEAIRGSLIVMHQVNSVILYVITFVFVDIDVLQCHMLLIICVIMALIGYLVYVAIVLLDYKQTGIGTTISVRRNLKTVALYMGFGYALSPVFKTLTETISTDTIYALSTFMFLVNIAFADYGIDVAVVSSALSLNAGIFGAVCLISRLPSSNEVFSLLTLAVVAFVLWPLLRWEIIRLSEKNNWWLGLISALLISIGLCRLSSLASITYLAVHLFVSLACPWGLMKMQPLKSTIHGPWDEAIVIS